MKTSDCKLEKNVADETEPELVLDIELLESRIVPCIITDEEILGDFVSM